MAILRILGANLDGSPCSNPNSNSLVLRLEYGSFKLLLPGDFQDTAPGDNGVQRTLIDAWSNQLGGIQADFYKVTHHGAYQGGSNTSTLANKDHFLLAVSPKYAFSSSAAPPNNYNHPHCGLCNRLTQRVGSIRKGNQVKTPQKCISCGRPGGSDVLANDIGFYSTFPKRNAPTIICIVTNGAMSSIDPIPYS